MMDYGLRTNGSTAKGVCQSSAYLQAIQYNYIRMITLIFESPTDEEPTAYNLYNSNFTTASLQLYGFPLNLKWTPHG